MKRKLLSALLALMLLLTACQYVAVEDGADSVLGPGGTAYGEESEMPVAQDEPQPLRKGSRDTDADHSVAELQNRLIALNFLTGEADGAFGGATERALMAFQEMNGLEETGVADEKTLLALAGRDAIPMPTPSPTPLAKGAKGEGVTAIQSALRVYGFLTGSADGDFGSGTQNAVKRFAQYMYDGTGEEFIDPTPTPSPTPAPTPTPAIPSPFDMPVVLDEEIIPERTFSPDGAVSDAMEDYLLSGRFEIYRGELSKGSAGAEVTRLQTRLASLLYLSSADGQYGSGTKEAVSYFQKRNKLEQTGVADEATQRALFSQSAVKSDKPLCMYLLKVDTSKQRVYAYKWVNGSYSNLVRTMVCSTGKYDTPTPLGTYTGGGSLGHWYYFQKYECWAQYAYRISGPYLFHSVLYSGKDTSTLRQSSVNNLGSRASHGCVRLSVEDAKWISRNCPAGTTIKVV